MESGVDRDCQAEKERLKEVVSELEAGAEQEEAVEVLEVGREQEEVVGMELVEALRSRPRYRWDLVR